MAPMWRDTIYVVKCCVSHFLLELHRAFGEGENEYRAENQQPEWKRESKRHKNAYKTPNSNKCKTSTKKCLAKWINDKDLTKMPFII